LRRCGSAIFTLRGERPAEHIWSAAFSPDGRQIVTTDDAFSSEMTH
jgi:hypothetical protein